MLDGRTGAGSDQLKSMHLVLLVFKLVCRFVNTVSK
jgi:hypothetical protein